MAPIGNSELEALPVDLKEMLHRHTRLDARKVVSYLPLNTIENVIGISVETYTSLIEGNGGHHLIFSEEKSCISSGAVYAFLSEDLSKTLALHEDVLTRAGIPLEPTEFIRTIANTWFESGSEIIPVLKRVFDDT